MAGIPGELTRGIPLAEAGGMARLGFGALLVWLICVVAGFSTTGCFRSCDECDPDTNVELAPLPASLAAPVSIEFRHAGDAIPRIRCQPKTVPGRAPNWDCDGPGESSLGASSFSYSVENGRDKWFVHIEGPSGPWDFEREPKDTDGGEAWPTSCPCSPYAIYISQEDFEKVGVSWE